MKTISVLKRTLRACPIAAGLLFLSCSNDTSIAGSPADETATTSGLASREGSTMPFNRDNVHDLTGELYTELLSTYYENANLPTSITDITALVEHTVNGNSSFTALKSPAYQAVNPNRVAYLYDHRSSSVDDALRESGMSTTAQSSLRDFIAEVLEYVEAEAAPVVLYDLIVAYEDTVMANWQLSAKDKEIILTTTSITRHSAHFRKKRPKKNTDPDWDWLTISIAGAAEGAGDGKAEAISLSLACGVVENR